MRLAVAALVLLLLGAFTAGQLRLVHSHVGDIECCCGPHGADDPCGCDDCPAADNETHQDTSATKFNPCGAERLYVTSPDLQRYLVVEVGIALRAPVVDRPIDISERLPPDRLIPPPDTPS